MSEATQIAIIAASASAAGGFMTAIAAIGSEWLRGVGERRRVAIERQAEALRKEHDELRETLDSTRHTVLEFALSLVSLAEQQGTSGRREPSSHLEKSGQLYLSVLRAVEALWSAAPNRVARNAIESLRVRVREAYDIALSPQDTGIQPRQIEEMIIDRLRVVSIAISPEVGGLDDNDYLIGLERLDDTRKKLGKPNRQQES